MQGASLQGAQRAGYGASGSDVNTARRSGPRRHAFLTEMDKTTAKNNASAKLWGLEKQARIRARTRTRPRTRAGWPRAATSSEGRANAALLWNPEKTNPPGNET